MHVCIHVTLKCNGDVLDFKGWLLHCKAMCLFFQSISVMYVYVLLQLLKILMIHFVHITVCTMVPLLRDTLQKECPLYRVSFTNWTQADFKMHLMNMRIKEYLSNVFKKL